MGSRQQSQRYQDIRRVTVVGSVIDIVLSLLKLIFGYIANSQALIADGIHSLSDLATNAMVMVATRQGDKAPDDEHPYGHARFETVATVALGIVLALVGIFIGLSAYERIRHIEELAQPGVWALVVAILSVLSKEWVFYITLKVAKKYDSTLLKANAWHARSDSFSSIIVIIGIAGAMLGYPAFDAYAAIGVALMIVKIGGELIYGSLRELVDSAVDEEKIKQISDLILTIDGVCGFHQLRTRSMGGKTFIDVHIQVEPTVSVSEGHYIAEDVRLRLQRDIDSVGDALVHTDIESEDDIHQHLRLHSRREIVGGLLDLWSAQGINDGIGKFTLHYLPSGTRVIVVVHLSNFASIEAAKAQIAVMEAEAEKVVGCDELRVHLCAR
ncbi:MAG: cation transporter [Gammaproteobacteria bacterium]|nr:cation transporter [Gammaproteobacteria bacterium]